MLLNSLLFFMIPKGSTTALTMDMAAVVPSLPGNYVALIMILLMRTLRFSSVVNLKENPEETFYATNGMRFVVGAFEISACSPPSRRAPSEPMVTGVRIPLGTPKKLRKSPGFGQGFSF